MESREASEIAAHKAKNAQQAVETARELQAEEFSDKTARKSKVYTKEAIREVFGENVESGRFIDTDKIPFICKDIEGIKKTQEQINVSIEKIHEKLDNKFVTRERFWPVQTLVFGCTGILLAGVVLALVQLVLK